MRMGIIGLGTVGGALQRWLFLAADHEVVTVDPPKGIHGDMRDCDAVFVCIPVNNAGSWHQDQRALEDCVATQIQIARRNQVMDHRMTPIFIRSTVLPGTCDRLAKAFEHPVYACPEFLTARHADEDMAELPIVTGAPDTGFLRGIFPGKELICVSNREAELAKYTHNVLGAEIIHRCNVIYQDCLVSGADYQKVIAAVRSTGHFGRLYTQVPGPDGKLGFGGACFPKDLLAFAQYLRNKSGMGHASLQAIYDENKLIRETEGKPNGLRKKEGKGKEENQENVRLIS